MKTQDQNEEKKIELIKDNEKKLLALHKKFESLQEEFRGVYEDIAEIRMSDLELLDKPDLVRLSQEVKQGISKMGSCSANTFRIGEELSRSYEFKKEQYNKKNQKSKDHEHIN
jgi:hypothetical protein